MLQTTSLLKNIQPIAFALLKDLETSGPYQPGWPNYSPLKKGRGIPDSAFHCHLTRGKPTFVVCWRVVNKELRKIEVYYVGSHENAPY